MVLVLQIYRLCRRYTALERHRKYIIVMRSEHCMKPTFPANFQRDRCFLISRWYTGLTINEQHVRHWVITPARDGSRVPLSVSRQMARTRVKRPHPKCSGRSTLPSPLPAIIAVRGGRDNVARSETSDDALRSRRDNKLTKETGKSVSKRLDAKFIGNHQISAQDTPKKSSDMITNNHRTAVRLLHSRTRYHNPTV